MTGALADVFEALKAPPVRSERPKLRRSAVAMILLPDRTMALIRRAERVGDPWSGHYAFPGGREEPEDGDLLTTAIRETREEVGVGLTASDCIGELDDVCPLSFQSLLVRPYVFALSHEPTWSPNVEVAALLHVSLDTLLLGPRRAEMRWPGPFGRRLPKVDLEGRPLWGITLRIIDDLLHRIDGRGHGLERLASCKRSTG